MLAILVAMAVATGLMLALRGGDDADNDDSDLGGRAGPIPDASFDAMPGPPWDPPAATPTPTPAPAPGSPDDPEPGALEPGPATDQAPAADPGTEPGEPQPEPAGGALIDGVALTFYTCIGDSTGAYCGNMASGQVVHRGAAACGYAWDLGQRFKILGDPYPDMVYTCLDRGGGPWLWIDVWFYDAVEGRAWRNHLPQKTVTVEMLP